MQEPLDTTFAPLALSAEPRGMSQLVQEFDWSMTPLGSRNAWPESLQTTVRILLASRFPMWMAWGPELTVLYNDSYARTTLGKKHPWALGKPAPVVWSEIWDEIGPRIRKVLATGEASWDETLPLILERSGYQEETYHTFSYSPLTGPDGRNAGMLCVVMEDTGRVLGERQLTSLGTLAATLVDANTKHEVYAAIECGLAEQKDISFALTYFFDETNSRLKLVAQSGIQPGHPAAPLELAIDSPDNPWPIDEVLTGRGPVTVQTLGEQFADCPSGRWDRPPSQARLVPITRRSQEGPAGVFIAALNPYRQLDASYAGYLDLIAGQIAASITNAEAYEEERTRAEALAELDRAKTAFFSNISHELRTPLTLILGPIEDALANDASLTNAQLGMLHRNAGRLLKLVNGLLDFVRIEAGRLQASYEPTDLALLTAQLASVFRSAVERAGLKLVVECPPLPEPIYVDREMWEKIVLNLLSNAFKSTFDGEIRVSLTTNGSEAQLLVADTGTGIPEHELPHLFERFRRVEGARRRSHEGSGIGLALIKELVEMHGGSIAVESTQAIGTIFRVTVPFGQSHLAPAHVISDAMNPVVLQGSAAAYAREALGWLPSHDRLEHEIARAAGVEDSGDRMRLHGGPHRSLVLLVDDNADMRAYVRDLLGGRFDVLVAQNGQEALEIIEHTLPDLVLTDVMMPEVDGFELLTRLRNKPATALLPVIILSAHAGEESRLEGVSAGADDYLIKPFTARELVARVDAQLNVARLRKHALEQEAALNAEIRQAWQFAWETLEHLPEAFCTFDGNFRVNYLNPAAAEIAHSSHEAIFGKTLWDLYPNLLGTPVETQFRRSMEERIPIEFEQYFPTPKGEFWYHFKVYPQPGDGLVLYVRNTTNERRTEQALRRSEQLAAAGRLAASIAHEINNPLEAVTNLLYLVMLEESVTGNARDLLEVADKELQRLSHITARSLKFYRQRTAPARTSLAELLDSVLFFHETELNLRGIALERRYRSTPAVLCLAGEVQQVLANLISNAVDAMHEGGKLIVAVRPLTDRHDRQGVLLTVADSGEGMNPTTMEQLFRPFVTTKGEDGTGLGLWVSKGILDKHHATIRVRSREGKGTVFRLFVPIQAVQS